MLDYAGYIRVSSIEQNPQRQLDGLSLHRTFIEYASGKDVKRPKLGAMLDYVRDSDTVVVHSMDRLARNLDNLHCLVQQLTDKVSASKKCIMRLAHKFHFSLVSSLVPKYC
ncbi:MAG: recombinase family protein [Gammaproteobacteria bacterium]|nr:recombinase family protein [Gammaproteobacteria bacterium]